MREKDPIDLISHPVPFRTSCKICLPLSIILLTALMLLGCSPLTGKPKPPPQYYLLSLPIADQLPKTATAQLQNKDAGDLLSARAIVLGPVEIPAYLDRLWIVKRMDHQLLISYHHKWAEPLDRGIERVLALRISEELPGVEIYPISFNAPATAIYNRALILTVNCFRFEAIDDDKVVLKADWSITDAARQKQLTFGSVDYHIMLDQNSWEAIITGMSRLVDRLGLEIANKIRIDLYEPSLIPSASTAETVR